MTHPSLLETSTYIHIPVLSQELLTGLNIEPGGHYLDATVGGGGHSRLILETDTNIKVTGIDRDAAAIAATKANLSQYGDERVNLWQGNFAEYDPKNQKFDGIIADLGVSSPQLDQPERGFSFRHSAPLDMRMDSRQSLTAADIINHWDTTELANLFYNYGEERLSRRIARAIVQKRPFNTTTELAQTIAQSVPASYRNGRIHPATRVFQALRLGVNEELESLQIFLNKSPHWLKPGGIIGIISFHSLEDRLIKHQFRDSELLDVLTKKPLIPQNDEQPKIPAPVQPNLDWLKKETIMSKIRIALIEDHTLTRTALRTALQQYREIEWVGEASNGSEGLQLLQKTQPDVGIVDIGLPDIDGIELTKKLKATEHAPKILILTLHDSEAEVLAAFAAGADSYCMKTISTDLLMEALKATQEGNTWIDPAIAKIVLSQAQGNQTDFSPPASSVVTYSLTERELEVLQLIVDGHSNAEIAQKLFITLGTVKTHVRNILNKLCADDRTQAAVRALRSGLVY